MLPRLLTGFRALFLSSYQRAEYEAAQAEAVAVLLAGFALLALAAERWLW